MRSSSFSRPVSIDYCFVHVSNGTVIVVFYLGGPRLIQLCWPLYHARMDKQWYRLMGLRSAGKDDNTACLLCVHKFAKALYFQLKSKSSSKFTISVSLPTLVILFWINLLKLTRTRGIVFRIRSIALSADAPQF